MRCETCILNFSQNLRVRLFLLLPVNTCQARQGQLQRCRFWWRYLAFWVFSHSTKGARRRSILSSFCRKLAKQSTMGIHCSVSNSCGLSLGERSPGTGFRQLPFDATRLASGFAPVAKLPCEWLSPPTRWSQEYSSPFAECCEPHRVTDRYYLMGSYFIWGGT